MTTPCQRCHQPVAAPDVIDGLCRSCRKADERKAKHARSVARSQQMRDQIEANIAARHQRALDTLTRWDKAGWSSYQIAAHLDSTHIPKVLSRLRNGYGMKLGVRTVDRILTKADSDPAGVPFHRMTDHQRDQFHEKRRKAEKRTKAATPRPAPKQPEQPPYQPQLRERLKAKRRAKYGEVRT